MNITKWNEIYVGGLCTYVIQVLNFKNMHFIHVFSIKSHQIYTNLHFFLNLLISFDFKCCFVVSMIWYEWWMGPNRLWCSVPHQIHRSTNASVEEVKRRRAHGAVTGSRSPRMCIRNNILRRSAEKEWVTRNIGTAGFSFSTYQVRKNQQLNNYSKNQLILIRCLIFIVFIAKFTTKKKLITFLNNLLELLEVSWTNFYFFC